MSASERAAGRCARARFTAGVQVTAMPRSGAKGHKPTKSGRAPSGQPRLTAGDFVEGAPVGVFHAGFDAIP